jgi:branched-chain amino acid transport system permease protein
VQLVINIIVLASIYAMIACGYVLIYRVSRVLNLAHGELMMLGAYLVLATASLFSGQPVLALGMAVLLSLTVGVLVYVFLMRKMTGEMVLAAILTTVALGILIRGAVVLIWSASQQYPAQALAISNPSIAIGSAHISLWSLVLVA